MPPNGILDNYILVEGVLGQGAKFTDLSVGFLLLLHVQTALVEVTFHRLALALDLLSVSNFDFLL